MKIKRNAIDNSQRAVIRFKEFIGVFYISFTSDDAKEALCDLTGSTVRVYKIMCNEVAKMTAGTEDEVEYAERVKTCGVYVEILKRNAQLASEGQPFNLLDCVVAASAYQAQYTGIKGTFQGEGREHLQPVQMS